MNTYSIFIYDSQKVEEHKWPSMDKWLNKIQMWYLHITDYYQQSEGMNYFFEDSTFFHLFIFQLQFTFNICISFSCTAQWLDNHTLTGVPPIFPIPTQLLQQYGLYSLCCTLHPCDYFVTTNLQFSIPLPFSASPTTLSPLATISLFLYL